MEKPWQVTIDYNEEVGHLYLRVRQHTHGAVAFSVNAATYCGGPAEEDEDGCVIRCHEEPQLVEAAREIARMSDEYEKVVADRDRWEATARRIASESGTCENIDYLEPDKGNTD